MTWIALNLFTKNMRIIPVGVKSKQLLPNQISQTEGAIHWEEWEGGKYIV